jgi:hypothetical protein
VTATASRCRHEGSTLVLTEEGFDVRIEAETLDPLGELRVVMAGRRTYSVHTYSGAVFARLPYKIKAQPAGTRPRVEVHAEHTCPVPRGEGES